MGLSANVVGRKLSENIVGSYANCMDETLRSSIYLYWRPIRMSALYNFGAFWCAQDYGTFLKLYIINFYGHRLSREPLDQKRISFTLSVGWLNVYICITINKNITCILLCVYYIMKVLSVCNFTRRFIIKFIIT